MAYRIGIAQGYVVRNGAVARDEAVRNAGLTVIAHVATDVGVGGVGSEAPYAVTASAARRGVPGTNAPTTKATSGMKAAASGTKAPAATMETTTAAAVETATSATMKTTATAAARLGYVCEREPHDCARQDRRERQRDLFEAPSSQHIFLHLN